jgi:hypothetical protein
MTIGDVGRPGTSSPGTSTSFRGGSELVRGPKGKFPFGGVTLLRWAPLGSIRVRIIRRRHGGFLRAVLGEIIDKEDPQKLGHGTFLSRCVFTPKGIHFCGRIP